MKPNTLILGKINVKNDRAVKPFILWSKPRHHKGELWIEENGTKVQIKLSVVHNVILVLLQTHLGICCEFALGIFLFIQVLLNNINNRALVLDQVLRKQRLENTFALIL